MATWPWVVIPGFILAIAVNLDNKYLGPYFALTDLVFGDMQPNGIQWYKDPARRNAVLRRIVYAIIAGFVTNSLGADWTTTLIATTLGGILLVWPAAFRPLPSYVSFKDWQVLFLWITYAASYGAFGLAGYYLNPASIHLTGKSFKDWAVENLFGTIVTLIIGSFLTSFALRSRESLALAAQARQNQP